MTCADVVGWALWAVATLETVTVERKATVPLAMSQTACELLGPMDIATIGSLSSSLVGLALRHAGASYGGDGVAPHSCPPAVRCGWRRRSSPVWRLDFTLRRCPRRRGLHERVPSPPSSSGGHVDRHRPRRLRRSARRANTSAHRAGFLLLRRFSAREG